MATWKKPCSHPFQKENPMLTPAASTIGYLAKGQSIDKCYYLLLGPTYQINTSNKRHVSISSGGWRVQNPQTLQTQGQVDILFLFHRHPSCCLLTWLKERESIYPSVIFSKCVSVTDERGLSYEKFPPEVPNSICQQLKRQNLNYKRWEYANIQSIVGSFMTEAPWTHFFVSSKFIFCLGIIWKAGKRHRVKWLQVVFYLQGNHSLFLY